MKWAFVRLRITEDRLVLASFEEMRPKPAKRDQLMLRKVILPTDDSVVFEPDNELREVDMKLIERVFQGEEHLVGIEDIGASQAFVKVT